MHGMFLRGLSLGVAALLPAQHALGHCVFVAPEETFAPGILLEDRTPIGVTQAPPGGVWWIEVIDDDDTGRCDVVEMKVRADNPRDALPVADLEIVHVGPRWLGIAVPVDAEPGTAFDATFGCARGGSVFQVLDVTAAVDLNVPPPSLVVRSVDAFSWTEPGCEWDDPDTTHHRTFIEVDVADARRALLLDAWLVPVGEPPTAESADRVADATALPIDVAQPRIQVTTPGRFDAHLRLIDAVTGQVSGIETVRVETPDERQSLGCAQTRIDDAPLVAGVTLLALRRHRRRARVRR